MLKPKYIDVVISGGGMVGLALACALGSSTKLVGKTVMLLESMSSYDLKEWQTSTFENRVSAITPGSKKFLQDINVWNGIIKRRFHPFNKMQIWEKIGPGAITFNSEDVGCNDIAYMVENNVIVESCAEQATTNKSVEMKYNSRITDIVFPDAKSDEDHISITTNDGEVIESKLLIGADGFNSFVRQKAGIESYVHDYSQSAVVATLNIKSSKSSNKTAFQRYLTPGPIALLPLSDEWSSLVWSTDKTRAKELLKMNEEDFCARVNEAYAEERDSDFLSNALKSSISTLQPGKHATNILAEVPKIISLLSKSRGMFPLAMMHANYYVKSRLVLIGDAAHRIHPMAGQGVNLGFGDVKALVQHIEDSVEHGKDFGTLSQLLPYESERQRHVVSINTAINGLNSLFSTELFPAVAARNLGLFMTDSISSVKDVIVKYAMY